MRLLRINVDIVLNASGQDEPRLAIEAIRHALIRSPDVVDFEVLDSEDVPDEIARLRGWTDANR